MSERVCNQCEYDIARLDGCIILCPRHAMLEELVSALREICNLSNVSKNPRASLVYATSLASKTLARYGALK